MKLLEICVLGTSRKNIPYVYLHFNSTWNVFQVFCLHLAVLDNQKPNTQRNCFLREQFTAGSWDYSRFHRDWLMEELQPVWARGVALHVYISAWSGFICFTQRKDILKLFSWIALASDFANATLFLPLQLLWCLSCLSQLLQLEQAWQV